MVLESFYGTFFCGISGSIAVPSAIFGGGSVPIAISYVGCVGNEATLLDCSHHESTCSHNQDAGVRCHMRTSKCVLVVLQF